MTTKIKKLTRPLRDLLLQLPHLTLTAELDIDYSAAEPALLAQLADNAEIVMRISHMGISAMGMLLAHSAPEIEVREIPGDAVEAVGWLMAELGEFAAIAQCIAVACRRHTADYAPRTAKHIPNARP